MAAIDRLYLNDYYDYKSFNIWCIKYKPELLYDFYNPFMGWNEWDDIKERAYNNELSSHKDFCDTYPTVDDYLGTFHGMTEEIEIAERNYWLIKFNELKAMREDKDEWKFDKTIPVCKFSIDIDKWLLWHCPLKCVRDYLENQCGYKTKWYHKIFWKGKNDVL